MQIFYRSCTSYGFNPSYLPLDCKMSLFTATYGILLDVFTLPRSNNGTAAYFSFTSSQYFKY